MSQSPAGVQIYLATSFVFTLFQGAALRHDPFREYVGLPVMGAPLPEAKLAKEFIELKKIEKEAIDARGDGELLGTGVLASGWQTSFAGSNRLSTIAGSPDTKMNNKLDAQIPGTDSDGANMPTLPFVSANLKVSSNEKKLYGPLVGNTTTNLTEDVERETPRIAQVSDDIIEAANRGERPAPPIKFAPEDKGKRTHTKLNIKRIRKTRKKASKAKHGSGKKNSKKK